MGACVGDHVRYRLGGEPPRRSAGGSGREAGGEAAHQRRRARVPAAAGAARDAGDSAGADPGRGRDRARAADLLPAHDGPTVYSINPMAVARYRERHTVARAKSGHADAMVLANILRTDVDTHRPLPADSELAQVIAVLARAQQDAAWNRGQLSNQLRSHLKQYFRLRWPHSRSRVLACARGRPGQYSDTVTTASLAARPATSTTPMASTWRRQTRCLWRTPPR